MSNKKEMIDFESLKDKDFKKSVKLVAGKNFKKVNKIDLAKITEFTMGNIKPIVITVAYLGLCGLGTNIYWIVKLIIKLF